MLDIDALRLTIPEIQERGFLLPFIKDYRISAEEVKEDYEVGQRVCQLRNAQLAKALWGCALWLRDKPEFEVRVAGIELTHALEQAHLQRPS